MRNNIFKTVMFFTIVLIAFSSCTTMHKTMHQANTRVELKKDDFTLSQQVSAEAKSAKLFSIDFKRLFKAKTGNLERTNGLGFGVSIASIPVIGGFVSDKTTNYALYNMMKENPGYDAVFYPQYHITTKKPVLGIGFIYTVTKVEAKARLGKLK